MHPTIGVSEESVGDQLLDEAKLKEVLDTCYRDKKRVAVLIAFSFNQVISLTVSFFSGPLSAIHQQFDLVLPNDFPSSTVQPFNLFFF